MKNISIKAWEYSFYEEQGKYFLSVMCGSVGIFELLLQLGDEEVQKYKSNGLSYIEMLVKDIQSLPSNYLYRNIISP